MKTLILWTCLCLAIGNGFAKYTKIEKRQICSNSGCGSCDGKSCNICNNDVCCSSVSCNKCVNQCSNDCSTVACKNNCVSGCSNTCQTQSCPVQSCSQCVNSCSNQCSTRQCVNDCTNNCNVCQNQVQPSPQSCSQCVNSCSNQCSTSQCANDCTNRCNVCQNPVQPSPIYIDRYVTAAPRPSEPLEPIIIEPPQASAVIVNNTNNNLVNLTTHININNVVNNFNNISVPVHVNTTNINYINITDVSAERSSLPIITLNTSYPIIQPPNPVPNPPPYPMPYPVFPPPVYPPAPGPTENNCCYIMHPRQCYSDEQGQPRCYIRRHRECSDGCTSPVVTIQEDEEQTNSGCQYIRNYPYAYCGNYVRRDCGQCYNCNGNYNPGECFRQSGCSDVCRRSIPNCVPSQSGLQCY